MSRHGLTLVLFAFVAVSISGCGSDAPTGSASPWSAAVAVHGLAGSSLAPQVAIDRDGNGIAAWRQVGGDERSQLWTAHYDVDRGWQPPIVISASGAVFTEHTLASDESGTAVVAWIEVDDITDMAAVRVARYVPGAGWMAPRSLVTLPVADGALSAVRAATSAEGIATVVWRRDDTLAREESLWSREYQPASGWLAEHVVAVGDLHDGAHAVEIVLDSTGRALVVWAQMAGGNVEIRSRRDSALLGSLGPVGWEAGLLVASLSPDIDGRFEGLRAGIDDTGKGFVAWLHGASGQLELSVASSSLTGPWGEPQSSGRVIDLGGSSGYGSPRIASASTGALTVAWRQGGADASSLLAMHFVEASGWTGVDVIADQLGAPCTGCADRYYFDVSVDADGNALVVWEEPSAAGPRAIWASEHASGGTWAGPSVLTSDSRFASEPVVALSRAGTGIAVWPQRDGPSTETSVWASRFSSEGL